MNAPITIRAFRAVDEPETCEQFFEGHVNVLRSYGVDPISSAKREWFINPAVYGLIAERQGKFVGGVKVHKVGGSQWLPVEEGVGYLDENIFDTVKKYKPKGAGEACGLWNAQEVAGMGVSYILSRAIIVLSYQLGINRLFALSSDHTIGMFRELGFQVIRSLGQHGDFIYPSPDYISRVIIVNAETLSTTTPYNRDIMFSLRETPNQIRKETGPKGEIEIHYQLHPSKWDETAHRQLQLATTHKKHA